MQVFLVGGAVRDCLMGRPCADRDYVVVGGSPAQMLEAGFHQVGAAFPVFLHPDTGDEYALARTERKTGPGYTGFTVYAAPDVSLADDLARRDLTVNAMARSLEGDVIDPYGGQADLSNKVLRHVCAESFVEDPVRVLRLARFAARYREFSVAPETLALCRQMVEAGELDHLVPERVWQEFAKGLMEAQPSRMFEVLRSCGALQVLLPELDQLAGVPQPAAHHPEGDAFVHVLMVVDMAAALGASLEVRFAALMHDLGKGVTPVEMLPSHHNHEDAGVPLVAAVCSRLKAPSACKQLALTACKEHTRIHRAMDLKATSMVQLFQRIDAFRRRPQFDALLQVCECDARGRLGFSDRAYPQADRLRAALDATLTVRAGEIARAYAANPKLIPERIYAARVAAVKALLSAEPLRA